MAASPWKGTGNLPRVLCSFGTSVSPQPPLSLLSSAVTQPCLRNKQGLHGALGVGQQHLVELRAALRHEKQTDLHPQEKPLTQERSPGTLWVCVGRRCGSNGSLWYLSVFTEHSNLPQAWMKGFHSVRMIEPWPVTWGTS